MIDLHCHILPGVDDGALDIRDSAGLARQAAADGVEAVGMLALADAGLIHVLSSDAHSSHGGRPAKMAAAFERLAEVEWLRPHLEWIRETAPRAIVDEFRQLPIVDLDQVGLALEGAVQPRRREVDDHRRPLSRTSAVRLP